MTIGEILALARYRLDDREIPYKWTDAELVSYFNEAESEACRRANLLVSYPSSITITGVSNISFTTSSKTISKPSGGFLSAGTESEVETFEKDDTITITGTSNNDGDYTIDSITDTEIVVVEALVDESNTSATIEATRTVTRIPITSGVHTYRLHPKILKVKRVKPDSLGYPIMQRTVYSLDSQSIIVSVNSLDASWETSLWYYSNWEDETGHLYNYIEDNGSIRLVGTPDEDDILWMITSRLPKYKYTVNDTLLTPETAAQYHADMVEWMLRLAFMKPDSETTDLQRATYHEKQYDKLFGFRPSAAQDMRRKRFPKTLIARPRPFGFS